MQLLLLSIFLATYLIIAFEHPLRINKAAPALIGAGLLWIFYAISNPHAGMELRETLASTAEIVFFLMGAMAIVEVIDSHDGFNVITDKINTSKLTTLLWFVSLITFFLSAVLDNLTTTIVMVSVIRKLIGNREDRLYFIGMVIIAANAGGAWSPIGDVTTTMLWIGGQITSLNIIKGVFVPSLVNMLIPMAFLMRMYQGKFYTLPKDDKSHLSIQTSDFDKKFMLFAGIGFLCAVPAFHTVTNLPPYLGILFSLGILWVCGELIHRNKSDEDKHQLSLAAALQNIDMSSMIFFVGILFSVATLEHSGMLTSTANWLHAAIGNESLIVGVLGIASAVIDNVPLVAASMAMYPIDQYPTDSVIWEFLAYAAGTGGSILIIGSAAGVAAMALEKIEFLWYLKKFGLLALAGYLIGAFVYILI